MTPAKARVLVDGVDVRDYDLKALRDKIGYVPQQSVLFRGTVASNVSYGDQPGDPAEVEMADTSTPAGRKREAALIAAGEAAEGADIPAESRIASGPPPTWRRPASSWRAWTAGNRRDRPRRIERVRLARSSACRLRARCTVTRKS